MVIYADVLICFNVFVNFLLLQAVKTVIRTEVRLFRQIAASVAGAVCSLYIFAPTLPVFAELAIRLTISCIVIFCLIGKAPPKIFIKTIAAFYGVSFVYAGIMFMLWFLLKPKGMVINNGVVYFKISPLLLVSSTAVTYIILKLINHLRPKPERGKLFKAHIFYGGSEIVVTALADTGHELSDMMSDSSVIVIGAASAEALFSKEVACAVSGGNIPDRLKPRYRLIPYSSVGACGLLHAVRCDLLEIECGGCIKSVPHPVVAISRTPLSDEYGAIIDAGLID